MKFVLSLSLLILSVAIFGTLLYHNLEDWSYIDSLYFTVVTMATVGYGDIHPTTEISRLFTVGFIVIGVGTMAYGITAIFEHLVEEGIRKRFSRRRGKIKIESGLKWDFGGRNEMAFKIKTFFKNLKEKIEKTRNKLRYKV